MPNEYPWNHLLVIDEREGVYIRYRLADPAVTRLWLEVYPTLLAAISDVAHPEWYGSAMGVYPLWRDGGYAVGALLSGLLADALGMSWAIVAIAGVTALSGFVVAAVTYETLPGRQQTALAPATDPISQRINH